MRNILNGCVNILVATFYMVLISSALSALFCGVKWLLSLLKICDAPTWGTFLYGGIGLFILSLIFTISKVVRMERRFKDDPEYKYNYDRWRQTHGDHF